MVPIKELIQIAILKRNLIDARMHHKSHKPPGHFKAFQSVYFDSSEDSDCEDGRAPKRKQVRLDTDGSMATATPLEPENLEVKPNANSNLKFFQFIRSTITTYYWRNISVTHHPSPSSTCITKTFISF